MMLSDQEEEEENLRLRRIYVVQGYAAGRWISFHESSSAHTLDDDDTLTILLDDDNLSFLTDD